MSSADSVGDLGKSAQNFVHEVKGNAHCKGRIFMDKQYMGLGPFILVYIYLNKTLKQSKMLKIIVQAPCKMPGPTVQRSPHHTQKVLS